ncbi:MAG TPA: hypothetical protein PLC89_29265 [Haliscomenobacter sp.]|uniref:hypothetical protein n=1 Tax=Haliscomenobacter sp. TaxID=2717303 RepID=UPI001DA50BDE|nr:hypothetical protein [Haliscomenobacter sp.]MBK9492907.1 hypothetical protein [Haliscomenobacter sp.]HOY21440.1 hypothetical protein [Haliscomenobacter sp.]HPH20102.1 hypothetical protein [Haliscomenobacter sp.]
MDASQKTTNPAAKPDEKKHTLKQALKDISTAGGITVFVITTLTSFSLPGILSTVLQGDFSLDAEGIVLIWKMILLTAPLTIGIVVVIVALMREWVSEVWGISLLTSAVLIVTTFFLREDGQSILSLAWSRTTGNPFFYFPIQLLLEYFRIYYWIPFVSSFIIGFFISWAINRLMVVKSWE